MSKPNWAGKRFSMRFGELEDGRKTVLLWVECPLCGEEHAVDDPEEKARESLYCDTKKVRVPFPNPEFERLRAEVNKLKTTAKDEEKKKGYLFKFEF